MLSALQPALARSALTRSTTCWSSGADRRPVDGGGLLAARRGGARCELPGRGGGRALGVAGPARPIGLGRAVLGVAVGEAGGEGVAGGRRRCSARRGRRPRCRRRPSGRLRWSPPGSSRAPTPRLTTRVAAAAAPPISSGRGKRRRLPVPPLAGPPGLAPGAARERGRSAGAVRVEPGAGHPGGGRPARTGRPAAARRRAVGRARASGRSDGAYREGGVHRSGRPATARWGAPARRCRVRPARPRRGTTTAAPAGR